MCDVIEVITCLCIFPGIVQLYRCQGLLQLAYHIVSKDRDNKDTIDDVLDFVEVQSLVGKSKQLFRKSVDQNTEGLVVDR